MEPLPFLSRNTLTELAESLAALVPLKVRLVFFVTLSILELPESDALARSGVPGVLG